MEIFNEWRFETELELLAVEEDIGSVCCGRFTWEGERGREKRWN
jgi:hypothetical protein